uniref:Peptidase S1 domain-containing protein n=1 Tax=Propithecus coquereli TaxID=379532 RepID=A0A2K6ERZ0_PROCO
MTVSKLFIHPDFDKRHRMSDDITLLQLHRSVDFSSHIRPVCLPESNMDIPQQTSCWITGWGMITEDDPLPAPLQLQEAEVGLIGSEFCGNYFQPPDPSDHPGRAFSVQDDMLCATDLINGKSICRVSALRPSLAGCLSSPVEIPGAPSSAG